MQYDREFLLTQLSIANSSEHRFHGSAIFERRFYKYLLRSIGTLWYPFLIIYYLLSHNARFSDGSSILIRYHCNVAVTSMKATKYFITLIVYLQIPNFVNKIGNYFLCVFDHHLQVT